LLGMAFDELASSKQVRAQLRHVTTPHYRFRRRLAYSP
jgi:hypothetical protein